MAGIAEHGLPASFHFLWFLCARFIVAALKPLTCHNSELSAAKSCNIDGLEEVDFCDGSAKKLKEGWENI